MPVHSSSSSSASESSMEDTFQLDTITSTAGATSTSKLNDNNGIGPLEQESKQALLAMEPGHGSKIDSYFKAHSATTQDEANPPTPRKSLSCSSSSSSFSSSESSSEGPFHLGENATNKSPRGNSSLTKLHDDTSPGILVAESNQKLSVMESENGNRTSSDLGTPPGTTTGEVDLSRNEKLELLSSSSSFSSESSSEDPLEMSANATSNSPAGGTGSHSLEKDSKLAAAYSNENIAVSSRAKHEQSNHELARLPPPLVISSHSNGLSSTDKSATQFPPVQVMERPGDSATASYRIPSYVFARTKSTAPVEWSCNSNESLFSIHMGNMSFTRDQLFWLGKSGDLEKPGEVPISGPLIDLSSNQPPPHKSTDIVQKKASLDEGSGITEATAAETMREVIKENAEDRNKESPSLAEKATHSASLSTHSDGSTSFAFPILTGDGYKSGSLSVRVEKQKQRSESLPQTSKVAPNVVQKRWLSFFSCCPFCSLGHGIV